MATLKNKNYEDDDIIWLDDDNPQKFFQQNKSNFLKKNTINKIDDDIEIIGEVQASEVYLIESKKLPINPRRSLNPNRKSLTNQLLITANYLQNKEPVKLNKNQGKDIFIISEDEDLPQNLDSDIQSLRLNSPENSSKEKTSHSENSKNQKEMETAKIQLIEKPKVQVKHRRTSLNQIAVNQHQSEEQNATKSKHGHLALSTHPNSTNIKSVSPSSKSSQDSKNRRKTSVHVKTTAFQKDSVPLESQKNKRNSIAIDHQIQKEKNNNNNNPFNEITHSVTNCGSSKERVSIVSKDTINDFHKEINKDSFTMLLKESQKLASPLPLKNNTRKSNQTNQGSHKNQVENNDNSTSFLSNIKPTNSNLNIKSSQNKIQTKNLVSSMSAEKLTRRSLQVTPQLISSIEKKKISTETSSANTLKQPKENFTIFRKEPKTKQFPSTMKSVSDCLYDFCFLSSMEEDNKRSITLNLDSKNLDMIEAHYMNDKLFYLQESFKIMQITLYKKENTKFNLFDLYIQFDKTFNYYIKNGHKNSSIEDFNYHLSSFNEYLRSTDIDLDIDAKKNQKDLDETMEDDEDCPLDIANMHWKKIISLNEKVLKNLVKEINSPDIAELNYCFFDIAKQLLEIFIRKIYQEKFFKHKSYLENYFNMGEEFFNSFLEIFENFVLKNLKQNLSENYVNQRFIHACHHMQHLIYYSLIFYRRFDKSKTKLFQLVSSYESICEKLRSVNKELQILFINFVLNHNEIKIKLCEKLLIDCRFTCLPVREESVNPKFSQFLNSNDNNEIICKYLKNLLNEKGNQETAEFLDLLNVYVECFVKLTESDTKSNDTLIATLFEIHDSMEDFSKSGRTLISNLRILIQTPKEDASCLTELIKQLFFYDHVSSFHDF